MALLSARRHPRGADLNMIAYGIRWPSLAEDSEILRKRIAPELRLRVIRAYLHSWLEAA